MRAFAILPRRAQASQLLVCRCQHLQSLQRRHGKCQVALRAVQPLDLGRHLCDRSLRFQRSLAHAIDLREELGELRFSILNAFDGVGVGGRLRCDEGRDVGFEGRGVSL